MICIKMSIKCFQSTTQLHMFQPKNRCETVGTLIVNNQYGDDATSTSSVTAAKEAERQRLNNLVPNPENTNSGFYTAIRSLLQADPKSRFEEFDFDVRESVYHSKRYEQLGRPRDCFTKPVAVNNLNRIYGIASHTDEPLYELVLPSNVPQAVQTKWKHFDACKKRYPYNEKFDTTHMFGRRYGALHCGLIRQCMKDTFDPSYRCVINDVQGDLRRRTTVDDGQVLAPLLEEFALPADYIFGRRSSATGSTSSSNDHFIECEPCVMKKDVLAGLSHLNRQRLALKHKCHPPVNFTEVHAIARSFDPVI